MIKYSYALNAENQVVCVDDIIKSDNKATYKCLSCGRELIARLGSIRKKHFAHKEEIVCSGETYLHRLGKQMFYDEYQYCLNKQLPFYLEYYQNVICNKFEARFNIQCNSGNRKQSFDLTRYFKNICLEKKSESFRPDLTISTLDGKEKIFIEITVTHQSSVEKTNSNNRIVEIRLKEEEDLQFLKAHKLSLDSENVKFLNFTTKTIINNDCLAKKCDTPFDCFIIFQSGKCILLTKPLPELVEHLERNKSKIVFYEVSRSNLTATNQEEFLSLEDTYEKFRKSVARAFSKKINIKNCFICRYHAVNTWEPYEPIIFCKFQKKFFNSNEGSTCQYFRVEKNYLSN